MSPALARNATTIRLILILFFIFGFFFIWITAEYTDSRRMPGTHLASSVPNLPGSPSECMMAALTKYSGICGTKFSKKEIFLRKKRGFSGLSSGLFDLAQVSGATRRRGRPQRPNLLGGESPASEETPRMGRTSCAMPD